MHPDHLKTKAQLIKELENARKRIAALEPDPDSATMHEAPKTSEKEIPDELTTGPSSSYYYRCCHPQVPAQKWEQIWGKLPQIGVVINSQGLIVYTNDYLLQITGWERNQIIGKDWFDRFIPAETRDETRKIHIQAMSQESPQKISTYEKDILTRSGELRKIFWTNVIIFDPHGNPIDLACIGMDLTKQIRAEEKLKASEKRMIQALESVNDAVWEWRADIGEVYYSPNWFTMLGYKPYELPQEFKTWRDLLHPDDLPTAEKIVSEHLKSGKSFQIEFRMRTKDGNWKWIYARGMTVEWSPKGSPVRMIGTHVDITSRKRMEQDLRTSEKKFRKIIDDVEMVALQGYNETRQVIFWNKASENLYGYSSKEAMGKKLEELIIPAHMRSAVVGFIADWYEKGIPIPAGELELMHKEGHLIPVYSSHVMQVNSDGSKEMYCIDVDLSATKKVHDQLLAAKEQAESASRAKSEFLANMSHEIRTPLNGILGMLQLLSSSELDSEQKNFIRLSVQASRRLTRLLSDILDLSRVEAGKLIIRQEEFDIPSLLTHILELYRPTAMHGGLALNLKIDPNIHDKLLGDSARLQQVLTNLIGNAFKFTDTGSITMEACRLSGGPDTLVRVLFTVTDTGIGIPDEKLKELFFPFSQANNGFQRRHQGAGLGLSICKQLVELMGGHIAIETEQGKGTSIHFCITFPKAASIPSTEENTTRHNISPSKLNVLLAEDETISRIAASKQIQMANCKVTAVENGKQALEALSTGSYNLIMMDIQMPIMDGLEATQAIRDGQAGEEYRYIPIIAMTAYAMTGDREKFIHAGMDDYLPKPIDKSDLQKMLNKFRHG